MNLEPNEIEGYDVPTRSTWQERVRRETYFLTMPLHAWNIRGRSTRRHYEHLKESEFWSHEQLENLRLNRLRKLVNHALKTSEFHRKRIMSLGLRPEDFNDLTVLDSLPLLTKDDIRANLESGLVSTAFGPAELHRIHTSGSTGEPFTIFVDRNQLEIRFAATLRALESTGWRFGEPQVRLWHQTLGMSKSQVIRERIDAWFLNRKFIPAFEFNPTSIERFISEIEEHQPVLLDGYAESLNFLATYLQTGKKLAIAPRAVMSSAQMLPAQTRETIERELQTRVFDKYGSREFSGIAYECPTGNSHHVVDECYIVEVLVDGRKAKPGEIGEVVITDLMNFATPMIRFRIGDLAVAVDESENCQCGRAHSRIGEIQGRTQAIVFCANGTWMPGTFFAHYFKDFESVIRFFQIEQTTPGAFQLKYVRGTAFTEEALASIVSGLRKYIGDTIVSLHAVESIPLVRTGKRSPVISHVPLDFQDLGTFSGNSKDL